MLIAQTLTGRVIDHKTGEVLPGVNVYYLDDHRVGTITNDEGRYEIERRQDRQMVFSYVGYLSDTLRITDERTLDLSMVSSILLDKIEIRYRKTSTTISKLDPLKTEVITEKELRKAACCNLSESFETNAGIDVSFTDAITGARQIEMLGLSGPYIQVTRELIPEIRGLMSIHGLEFTPGHWLQSIQLNKGAGSVSNGFESITGQINTELHKPCTGPFLYANVYANAIGRLEANLNLRHTKGDRRWEAGTLLHAKRNQTRRDINNDNFLDFPLRNVYLGAHRWKYTGDWTHAQIGVKLSHLNALGGQVDFSGPSDISSSGTWGYGLDINRVDAWAKIGRLWEHIPWKSIGLQMSVSRHDQESYYGLRDHDALQSSAYLNLIYETIISNTNHKIKTGASFYHDDYLERVDQRFFDYTEQVIGAFAEYNYDGLDNFDIVLGLRADHHNLYGFFMTPRMHLRYAITDETILRASAGRGQRTAQIFAENPGILASNRKIRLLTSDADLPHGLAPEVAWNMGLNVTHDFKIGLRNASLGLDLYRTSFENQVVVDYDFSPQELWFYNLDGKSYSNSLQIQLDHELIDGLDLRWAYRWYDVQTDYRMQRLSRPLIAAHRAFLNASYKTENEWHFDATLNWIGAKRIPFTTKNPEEFRLAESSPSFFLLNAQISKSWGPKWNVYLGSENLLGFRQKDPILGAADPFGDFFDSSMVWGPIMGRNIYIGMRYSLDEPISKRQ